jgi:prepilin-type N-terminal cleavage/methylation domain-containing protein
LKKNKRSNAGFTLVEIMIVVAIIAMISGFAIPYVLRARETSQRTRCIDNLRQIESAKQRWGLDNNKANGDWPDDAELFGADLYLKEKPLCPASGIYTLSAIGTNAYCSIAGHSAE